MLILRDLQFKSLLFATRNYLGEIAYIGEEIQEVPQELKPFLDFSFSNKSNISEKDFVEISQLAPIRQGTAPALFLDRDGIINVDHGYVGHIHQVTLMPGIANLIHRANHQKIPVDVVTNQSGIGRGLYTEENYNEVMTYIQQLLAVDQAKLNCIEFAPFHPDAQNPKYHLGRHFRKPRPGMILKLQIQHSYNLQNSILIGDKASDLMAAMVAGVGYVYLFESEQSNQEWLILKNWLDLLKKYGMKDEFAHITIKQLTDFSEVHL